MQERLKNGPACGRIPKSRFAFGVHHDASGHDGLTIGAEGQSFEPTIMWEVLSDGLPGHGIPKLCSRVIASCQDRLAVRTKSHGHYFAAMRKWLADRLPCGCFQQPGPIISISRQDRLAVRTKGRGQHSSLQRERLTNRLARRCFPKLPLVSGCREDRFTILAERHGHYPPVMGKKHRAYQTTPARQPCPDDPVEVVCIRLRKRRSSPATCSALASRWRGSFSNHWRQISARSR